MSPDGEGTIVSRERMLALGPQIQVLVSVLSAMDKEALVEAESGLQNEVRRYETIGIFDGLGYAEKLRDKKAKLRRIGAILDLVKVSAETQKDIIPLEG
jgi:predicted aconitase